MFERKKQNKRSYDTSSRKSKLDKVIDILSEATEQDKRSKKAVKPKRKYSKSNTWNASINW